MTSEDDARFMRMAIEASRTAAREGDMPYGATLVSGAGELLQVSRNNQFTARDATGHAEIVLIREAVAKYGLPRLEGATVYASGEPCAMCAGAIFWAGISRVVFGMSTGTIMRVGGEPTLAMTSADVLATASRPIAVEGPLLEEEAAAVLAQFVRDAAARNG